jgi:hypothetical protein
MKKKPALKPRKTPKQARSRQMREDILAASIRVLRRHGALRFDVAGRGRGRDQRRISLLIFSE